MLREPMCIAPKGQLNRAALAGRPSLIRSTMGIKVDQRENTSAESDCAKADREGLAIAQNHE
jgi:hypothetical protein